MWKCLGAKVDGTWMDYKTFHPKVKDIILHHRECKTLHINGATYKPKWVKIKMSNKPHRTNVWQSEDDYYG